MGLVLQSGMKASNPALISHQQHLWPLTQRLLLSLLYHLELGHHRQGLALGPSVCPEFRFITRF